MTTTMMMMTVMMLIVKLKQSVENQLNFNNDSNYKNGQHVVEISFGSQASSSSAPSL